MTTRRKRILGALLVLGIVAMYRPFVCNMQELEPVPSDNPRGISQVAWGQRLFTDFSCTGCHSITGNRGIGGALNGIVGETRQFVGGGEAIVDEDYLRESIRSPRLRIVATYSQSMPTFELNGAQVDALIAYITQLR